VLPHNEILPDEKFKTFLFYYISFCMYGWDDNGDEKKIMGKLK
jgi:hypothetical protein